MGVIIIILISTLFFMGFFSIYIRHWSEDSSTTAEARNPVSVARSRRNQGGLNPTVIDSFPTFNYSAVRSLHIGNGASECAVCLEEFEDDETLRLIPNCDHVFHPECIDDWLVAHASCPLCRANLVPQPGESIHALELGQISEHNSDQDGVAVDAPDPQYGSHHQSMNNNVDEESMEQPLHAPPLQPEMADFSTTLPYASWPVEGWPPGTAAAQGLGYPTAVDFGIFYNTPQQLGFGGRVGEESGWGERFTPRLDGYVGRPVRNWPTDTATQNLRFPTTLPYQPGFGGRVGEGSGWGERFTPRLDGYVGRPVRNCPTDTVTQSLRFPTALPYQPGFGGGVGEGSGWRERLAGMQVQTWPSDTTAQGLRFPTAFELGIFYNTPHQPGFGGGVGEGSSWRERLAGMPAQGWPSDTTAQGLRFPTVFDLGMFYNTPYLSAGVGEGGDWSKRQLDANRPAQRWPPTHPRAFHLGTVYNNSNRPCLGGGVGEGNGRGGGQLNGYANSNSSAQSRSTTSTAAQSFPSRRTSDFETSRRTRCQGSFDGGVGKGSSRSTGIVSKDSDTDSELSYGSS